MYCGKVWVKQVADAAVNVVTVLGHWLVVMVPVNLPVVLSYVSDLTTYKLLLDEHVVVAGHDEAVA